jgi:hypothetical protein
MYLVSWSPLTIPPYPTVSLSSLSFRLVEIPARTQLYSPSYWSVRLEHTTKATRLTRLAVQQRSICGTGALVRAPSIVLYPVCRCAFVDRLSFLLGRMIAAPRARRCEVRLRNLGGCRWRFPRISTMSGCMQAMHYYCYG